MTFILTISYFQLSTMVQLRPGKTRTVKQSHINPGAQGLVAFPPNSNPFLKGSAPRAPTFHSLLDSGMNH